MYQHLCYLLGKMKNISQPFPSMSLKSLSRTKIKDRIVNKREELSRPCKYYPSEKYIITGIHIKMEELSFRIYRKGLI